MNSRKVSSFPTYDPAKDGNKFEWIVRQAPSCMSNRPRSA